MTREFTVRKGALKKAYEEAIREGKKAFAIPCRCNETLKKAQEALYELDSTLRWRSGNSSDRGKKQVFSLKYLWRNPTRVTVKQAQNEIRAGRRFYVIVELERRTLYWRPGESYLYETGGEDKEYFAIAKNIWRPARND